MMPKAKKCVVCKGSGKCRHCQGRGLVLKHAGAPSTRCLECSGSGVCPACHGEGVETPAE